MPIISPQRNTLQALLGRGVFEPLWKAEAKSKLQKNVRLVDEKGEELFYYGAVRVGSDNVLVAVFSPEKNLQGMNKVPCFQCNYGVVLQHQQGKVEVQPVIAEVGDGIITLKKTGVKEFYRELL